MAEDGRCSKPAEGSDTDLATPAQVAANMSTASITASVRSLIPNGADGEGGKQARKLFISTTVILLNFNVTLGSSLPSGAASTLNAHFGVTSELQKPLPVAVFLVGYSTFNPVSPCSLIQRAASRTRLLCAHLARQQPLYQSKECLVRTLLM
jgi:hypothetical protein